MQSHYSLAVRGSCLHTGQDDIKIQGHFCLIHGKVRKSQRVLQLKFVRILTGWNYDNAIKRHSKFSTV